MARAQAPATPATTGAGSRGDVAPAQAAEPPVPSEPPPVSEPVSRQSEDRAAQRESYVERAPSAVYEPPPPPPPVEQEPHTPSGSGIQVGLGFAFGGDDLVEVQFTDGTDNTLKAGNGFVLSVGGTFTPLWSRNRKHGVGLGLDLGVKLSGITASNGSLSFTRFPLVPSLHYLIGASDTLFVMVAGGLHYEFAANLSGDGFFSDVEGDFGSALGWMAEAGVYLEPARARFGLDLTLRYTALSYDTRLGVLDADNIGIFMAAHFVF